MRMYGVTDPNHQLLAVGWEDGLLAVQWKKGQGEHRGVPEDVYLKLRRARFAYRQYQLTVKGKFPYTKVEDPPEEPNGSRGSNIQDVAGRDSNSGPSGDHQSGRHGRVDGCDALLSGRLHDSRCAVGSKGERMIEFFREEDGLTFVEEGHRYELNGKRLISLTQILDASGLVDYSMVQPDVLAAKAQFGTKVHEYTKWHDQGELDPEDMDQLKKHPKYGPRITGWLQFLEDFHFTPDLNWCEVPCAVKLNGMLYAMTIDRFGIMGTKEEIVAGKGVPAVVEIKTCCDHQPSHQIQTAGQAVVFRGDGSVPLKRYGVYLLDKPKADGRYYRAEAHEDRLDEKVFVASLMLVQYRINNSLLKG